MIRLKNSDLGRRMLRLGIVAICLSLVLPWTAFSSVHPSLIDPERTDCAICHGRFFPAATQHPPAVESCLNCHEFSSPEGKTDVELVDQPPGLCVLCHMEKSDAADGSLKTPHFPVTDSCTNCHDPHSSSNPRLLRDPVPDLCLTCHDADALDDSHQRRARRSNCINCHDQHGSNNRLMFKSTFLHRPFEEGTCQACHRTGLGATTKARPPQLCFACHGTELFARTFVHTAVRDGLCLGCHDPHVGTTTKLLRASGPELCLRCHDSSGKKLASKTTHFPASDDCLTCHDPHSTDNERQLVDVVPDLCLGCHDAEDEDLIEQHQYADLTNLRCTGCHDPHGSDQPHLWSSTSIHPPFEEQGCDFCHEGRFDQLAEDGAKTLCYMCHTEIQEIVETSKVQHMAFEIAECTQCHTPHASQQRRLKKLRGGQVCVECHFDKGPEEEGETAHGVIDLIGCEACHEPHGGPNRSMLRVEGTELCLGCHVESNRRTRDGEVVLLDRFSIPTERAASIPTILLNSGRDHPVTGHRVSGKPTEEELARVDTTYNDEFSCFTCHNPHKGKYRLLVDGVASATEMCMKCHER